MLGGYTYLLCEAVFPADHVPLVVLPDRKRKPWITHRAKCAIHIRNTAWRAYRETGAHRKFLAYKRLRNKAVKVVTKAKISF